MLIKCPECTLQVSDKAIACPHCGYPLKPEKQQMHTKIKRLPNGFGQITKINNQKLRNPYRAMVSVGKTETGRPIQKLLKPKAYFKTYNEAYAALVDYNKNPYTLDAITFESLYTKWSAEYFKTLKPASAANIEAVWKHCVDLYSVDVREAKPMYLREFIINLDATPTIKFRIKTILNTMLDYALQYELIQTNYAKMFQLPKDITRQAKTNNTDHKAFSEEEINILWANSSSRRVKTIRIQIYMGWRPQELFAILTENVDLKNGFIIGGMKTDNGKDRKVPIHSKIYRFVEEFYREAKNDDRKYLLEDVKEDNSKLNYHRYRYDFMYTMKSLNITDHRPHDPRKTFVTLAKKYNVDDFAIKRIAGHSIKDITERIYTERDDEWLKTEIEKIK